MELMVLAERDARGQRIEHDYDDLDRETARRYFLAGQAEEGAAAAFEAYIYDFNNNVTQVIEGGPALDGTATTSYAYDSGNPHVELENAIGQRIDPAGNTVTRRSRGNHTSIDYDL